MTLELWYPADRRGKKPEVTTYQDVSGSGPDNPERPLIPFEFAGRALRNAKPNIKEGPYPLVIVSHGYPGSRVLLTYLTEFANIYTTRNLPGITGAATISTNIS